MLGESFMGSSNSWKHLSIWLYFWLCCFQSRLTYNPWSFSASKFCHLRLLENIETDFYLKINVFPPRIGPPSPTFLNTYQSCWQESYWLVIRVCTVCNSNELHHGQFSRHFINYPLADMQVSATWYLWWLVSEMYRYAKGMKYFNRPH